ncbi:hypothetical protein RUM44_001836 [Polyplax serrata]|uniref:Dysbindin domain-containing protein 1 n=1 Tax=Polyplax serrata TaxID=468196 RepID=A0ABR1AMN6_POLSC
MFGSIRDKFINLQENLSVTLRGLSVSEPSSRKQVASEIIPVNINAGADILENFQTSWSMLHELSQQNATKAQEVDKLTTNLHSRAEKQWKGVAHLTGVLLMLPEIVQTMNVLKVKTSVIAELFETVEKSLIELEDIMEERELQQKKTDQEIQLSLHKDKRLAILDDLRYKLEDSYKAKLINYERSLKQQLVENKDDIRTFKDAHAIPKIEIAKINNEPSTSLEDVILENEDTNNLEEFLSDTQESAENPNK